MINMMVWRDKKNKRANRREQRKRTEFDRNYRKNCGVLLKRYASREEVEQMIAETMARSKR